MTTANELTLAALLEELRKPDRTLPERLDVLERGMTQLFWRIQKPELGVPVRLPAGWVNEFTVADETAAQEPPLYTQTLGRGRRPAATTNHDGAPPHRPTLAKMPQVQRWGVAGAGREFAHEHGKWVKYADIEPILRVLGELVQERNHPYSRQALAVMERAKELCK